MADKSIPLSVRMTTEDMAMLSALQIADAVTPSEKLRRLVRTAWRQRQASRDFAEALAMEQERFQPLLNRIRALEARHRVHSELLLHVIGWLPDMNAAAVTAIPSSGKPSDDGGPGALEEAEEAVAERVFGLMLTALNFSLSPKAHCYRPEAVTGKLPAIVEIARLLDRDTLSQKGK